MTLRDRFIHWQRGYFLPVPTAGWEWFFMRLFFAMVVFHSFESMEAYKYDSIQRPDGIARFVDLSFLANHDVLDAIKYIAWGALVAYVCVPGRMALFVSLPVLTICSTLVRTFVNSQGATHHGFQIVTLTLLTQTIVIWWVQIWQWRKRERWTPATAGLSLESYLVYHSQALILATYVLAAIAKIINSKGMWIFNAHYLSIDVVKAHRAAYYKDLDPALERLPAIAAWMISHPLVATAVYAGGFFLELFALVGMRSRAWAAFFGIALILMHRGIYLIMNLKFVYHELLMLIFLVNVPFWIVKSGRALKGQKI